MECSLPRGPSCWICQWITHEPLSAWQGGSNAIADGFIPWSRNVKSWQHIAATLLWPPDNVRNSFLPAPLHSSPANIARFGSTMHRQKQLCYEMSNTLLSRAMWIIGAHLPNRIWPPNRFHPKSVQCLLYKAGPSEESSQKILQSCGCSRLAMLVGQEMIKFYGQTTTQSISSNGHDHFEHLSIVI